MWHKAFHIIADLYKALWKNTSGRPWTYVMREWVDKHTRISGVILPCLFAGFIAATWPISQATIGWRIFLTILQAFAWMLTGHLFWDTAGAYIPKRKRKRWDLKYYRT